MDTANSARGITDEAKVPEKWMDALPAQCKITKKKSSTKGNTSVPHDDGNDDDERDAEKTGQKAACGGPTEVSPIESGRVADGDRLSFGDPELGTKDVRISCNKEYEYANAQAHRPPPGRQRERSVGWGG